MINKILRLIVTTSFFLALVSIPLKAEQKIGVGVIGNIASFDTGGTKLKLLVTKNPLLQVSTKLLSLDHFLLKFRLKQILQWV